MADALHGATGAWWVIAGAAAALHGLDVPTRDVDVLLDTGDADRLLPSLGLRPRPGLPDARFRSDLFARWCAPPLPVEFMAGLGVRDGGGWTALRPTTRQAIMVGECQVFVPTRPELVAILRRFGRAKDHDRADRLEALNAASTRNAGRPDSPATRP